MRRLILAVLAAMVAMTAPAHASSVRLIATNCNPFGFSNGKLVYNSRNAQGLWDAYVSDDQDCVGHPLLPAYDGHRGISDVTPDGRFILLETAVGSTRTQQVAEPGKGVNNDIQLLDTQDGGVRTLVSGRKGTIWAEMNDDATQVVWSQLEQPSDLWNHLLGVWSLHVADITSTGVSNEVSYQHPTEPGFIETYGWLPDGRLIYASDSGSRDPFMWWLGSQLWAIDPQLQGPAQRLTPPFEDPTWCSGYSWCQTWFKESSPYHEFAHVTDLWLDGPWIVTSIKRGAVSGGMDLWRQRIDGTGVQRVTWFGGSNGAQVPGWPAPRYVVVLGGMAFRDGKILVSVAGDANATTKDAYEVRP